MLHKVQPHTAWTVNLKLNILYILIYFTYIDKKGVNNTKFNINLTIWCCRSFYIYKKAVNNTKFNTKLTIQTVYIPITYALLKYVLR